MQAEEGAVQAEGALQGTMHAGGVVEVVALQEGGPDISGVTYLRFGKCAMGLRGGGSYFLVVGINKTSKQANK